eukprot:TRINITY_DN778050_c0_g1_i1.p1 TRINITY_DN778050_c0_g1~~TRINITY_DN778050_c0_g1_i1.p1  ORF type:complete len:240 (-),score=29.54 TRINITY_DN778050_c0_g1_i1:589-1308(-)
MMIPKVCLWIFIQMLAFVACEKYKSCIDCISMGDNFGACFTAESTSTGHEMLYRCYAGDIYGPDDPTIRCIDWVMDQKNCGEKESKCQAIGNDCQKCLKNPRCTFLEQTYYDTKSCISSDAAGKIASWTGMQNQKSYKVCPTTNHKLAPFYAGAGVIVVFLAVFISLIVQSQRKRRRKRRKNYEEGLKVSPYGNYFPPVADQYTPSPMKLDQFSFEIQPQKYNNNNRKNQLIHQSYSGL